MPSTNDSSNRRRHMRRWMYAPMVAAVAAGAVCTGVGIGSAIAADTLQSGGPSAYVWSVTNKTDQPVRGDWTLSDGDQSSRMDFLTIPLAPGQKGWARLEGGSSIRGKEMTGHICYDHTWRTPGRRLNVGRNPLDFVLATDSYTGALTVSYGFDDTVALYDDGTPC